jgi:hypothetical protein
MLWLESNQVCRVVGVGQSDVSPGRIAYARLHANAHRNQNPAGRSSHGQRAPGQRTRHSPCPIRPAPAPPATFASLPRSPTWESNRKPPRAGEDKPQTTDTVVPSESASRWVSQNSRRCRRCEAGVLPQIPQITQMTGLLRVNPLVPTVRCALLRRGLACHSTIENGSTALSPVESNDTTAKAAKGDVIPTGARSTGSRQAPRSGGISQLLPPTANRR